jgi:hypothetical protein
MVSDDDDAEVKLVDYGFAAKTEGNSLTGFMGVRYIGYWILDIE